MKTLKFFALVGIVSVLPFFTPTAAARLEQLHLNDEPNNYVVIGAFSVHKNAIRFTEHAHKDLKMDARFEMNRYRNLYYVYVLTTADHALAIREAKRLRQESEFTDTWVYHGPLNVEGNVPSNQARGIDINPETTDKIDDVRADDKPSPSSNLPSEAASSKPASERPSSSTTTTSPESETTTSSPATTAAETAAATTAKAEPDNGVEGKKFFFKLTRAVDNATVEGDVDAIDVERARKMGTYKGNAPVKVSTPNNKSGQVSLVCEVFGYRKVQHDINYNTPSADEGVTVDESGATVVPFELARLQKGDIAIMYNVYFFKDAAIMRPESRYEVNSLLEMLNENPKYKIRLHGHTNGGAAGKIISMGKDSKNFFSLTDTKDGFGSAKQLSEERAIIIRDFLISNGIDPKRMEVKAWGGKRPLQDKHSTRAQENVRVEVEILEN